MQIVGRECTTCGAQLRSESGAIACERCELAFHTACLKQAAPTTYRDATAKRRKGAPLLCPTCGDDLRALKKQRDAARDAIFARAEAIRARRKAAPPSTAAGGQRAVLLILLGIGLLALRFVIAMMSH